MREVGRSDATGVLAAFLHPDEWLLAHTVDGGWSAAKRAGLQGTVRIVVEQGGARLLAFMPPETRQECVITVPEWLQAGFAPNRFPLKSGEIVRLPWTPLVGSLRLEENDLEIRSIRDQATGQSIDWQNGMPWLRPGRTFEVHIEQNDDLGLVVTCASTDRILKDSALVLWYEYGSLGEREWQPTAIFQGTGGRFSASRLAQFGTLGEGGVSRSDRGSPDIHATRIEAVAPGFEASNIDVALVAECLRSGETLNVPLSARAEPIWLRVLHHDGSAAAEPIRHAWRAPLRHIPLGVTALEADGLRALPMPPQGFDLIFWRGASSAQPVVLERSRLRPGIEIDHILEPGAALRVTLKGMEPSRLVAVRLGDPELDLSSGFPEARPTLSLVRASDRIEGATAIFADLPPGDYLLISRDLPLPIMRVAAQKHSAHFLKLDSKDVALELDASGLLSDHGQWIPLPWASPLPKDAYAQVEQGFAAAPPLIVGTGRPWLALNEDGAVYVPHGTPMQSVLRVRRPVAGQSIVEVAIVELNSPQSIHLQNLSLLWKGGTGRVHLMLRDSSFRTTPTTVVLDVSPDQRIEFGPISTDYDSLEWTHGRETGRIELPAPHGASFGG